MKGWTAPDPKASILDYNEYNVYVSDVPLACSEVQIQMYADDDADIWGLYEHKYMSCSSFGCGDRCWLTFFLHLLSLILIANIVSLTA